MIADLALGSNVGDRLAHLQSAVDGLAAAGCEIRAVSGVYATDPVGGPEQAEFLATHYGGPLERVTLERSFHVATQDYDKELIFSESVAFANRVCNS